jgi:peptidoglycan/xylan/chitin deacetylase (PgdA/CDA1 family)
MNKKIFLISAILLGLSFTSCSKVNKKTASKDETTNKVVEKENVVENKTMNTAAQILAKPEVPVLCYHRISDGNKGDYTVSPATFSAHIKTLADSGYHSVSPAQLYDYLVYNTALPEKPVMIAFDDSRIEHLEIAAPVMEKAGFRGVFFIMTITYNKKNYMSKDQIAALTKSGHTVGLHSWDHTMATKYKEASDWEKQVIEPKKKLEGIVGKPVEYWAYPNGVYNHESAMELSKHFKLSFILFSKRDSIQPLQTIRRIIIPECTGQGLIKSMKRAFGK